MLDNALNVELQDLPDRTALDHADPSAMSDSQLVAAVVAGEESAFEEIFNRYRRHVARTVGRFFREQDDIEEFLQQSFTKTYFSLNKFKGNEDSSLAAWITRITINVCYDEFRRRERTRGAHSTTLSEDENDHLEMMTDERAVSAEDSVLRAQLADKVLTSLTPKDRMAVTLVYSQDYSIDEAAGLLGMTSSSLKSRLFRCRNQLKARFGYLFR